MQKLVSECIESHLSSTRQDPAQFTAVRVAGQTQTWGLFFELLNVSVQKLENAVEFYGAISNNKQHGLCSPMETEQIHLLPIVDWFASEGIIQFFFKDTNDNSGFNIYILDETNWVEACHHCEGSKRGASARHQLVLLLIPRPFTYGSGFINSNLLQFYQIMNLNGCIQVVPVRSSVLSHW